MLESIHTPHTLPLEVLEYWDVVTMDVLAVISKSGSFSTLLSSLTTVFTVSISHDIFVHSTIAKYFVVGANKFVDNILLYASSVKGHR